MGDRAQTYIITEAADPKKLKESRGVFLYTHWGGCEALNDVQAALARREQWTDETYLARIIFDAIKGDDITGSTGFGIGSSIQCDIEYPLIVVDPDNQEVRLVPGRFWDFDKDPFDLGNPGRANARMSFEDFVALELPPNGAAYEAFERASAAKSQPPIHKDRPTGGRRPRK